MKIYTDIEQGSEDWFALRSGKITGSPVSCLITAKTLSLADNITSRRYMRRIIQENKKRINFDAIFPEHVSTWQMNMGKMDEEEAYEWYLAEKKLFGWDKVAFVEHSSGLLGCSPDAVQFEFGELKIVKGLEIKSPQSIDGYSELIDCKTGDDLKEAKFNYWCQTQFNMYVCNLPSWEFLMFVNEEKRKRGAECNDFTVYKNDKVHECFDLILANLQNELRTDSTTTL